MHAIQCDNRFMSSRQTSNQQSATLAFGLSLGSLACTVCVACIWFYLVGSSTGFGAPGPILLVPITGFAFTSVFNLFPLVTAMIYLLKKESDYLAYAALLITVITGLIPAFCIHDTMGSIFKSNDLLSIASIGLCILYGLVAITSPFIAILNK